MSDVTRRAVVAGIVGSAALGTAAARAAARQPPDIIFILADDMGFADAGAYGGRTPTPNIDSLARDGLLFTQAYANSCVCSPTRTALMTGLYQQRLPIGVFEPLGPFAPPGTGLPPGRPTLAGTLRDASYRTALVGKWHLGSSPQSGPLQHGYDSHYGIIHGGADYFTHRFDKTGQTPADGLVRDDQPTEAIGYLTDLLGDEAVKVVAGAGAGPLFLSLHFTAPHWPWEGPEDRPVSVQLKEIYHRDGGSLEAYAAMLKSMDANIGKVLRAVAKRGRARDTIVIFTSDNGGERFSDSWPLTGTKGELLEGGIRVPLLIRWPRRIRAGGRSPQVCATMDFMPTLLAAAGTAVPSGLDGTTMLDVWTGVQPRERPLFWRFKTADQAAARIGDWKYLKLGGREYLFNLAEDPRERGNRKDREPARFADLKARWAAWNATLLPYHGNEFSEDVKLIYPDRY